MDSELLRRHVAIHEAGHAVIARILNVVCGDCRIGPETWPDGHVSEGCAGFAPSEIIARDRQLQGLPPSNQDVMFLVLGEHADVGDGGDADRRTHPKLNLKGKAA
jgi:hypothetical protein